MTLSRWHYRRERVPLRGVLRYSRRCLVRRAMRGAAGTTSRRCRTAQQEALVRRLDRLECGLYAPLAPEGAGPYLGIRSLIDLDGHTLEESFALAATAMRDALLPADDVRIARCVEGTWKRALARAEEASHAAQDAPAAEDAAAPAGDGFLHPDPIFLAPLPSAAGKAPGASA